MSDVINQIPFELRAIHVAEVAALLGLAPRTVLENVASRPDFPKRVSLRPASWIAGDILEWRSAQVNKQKKPYNRRGLPR